jgi:hypothetical protein
VRACFKRCAAGRRGCSLSPRKHEWKSTHLAAGEFHREGINPKQLRPRLQLSFCVASTGRRRFSLAACAATASQAMTRIRLGLMGLLLFSAACGPSAEERIDLGDSVESSGIRQIEHLTDGRRKLRGAHWQSSSVTFIDDDRAYAIFDLGEVTPIEAAYIQGDNNDRFFVEVSDDGQEFATLWVAPAVSNPGLQPRMAKNLGGSGRFVRLRAIGGDRFISISELQLFNANPSSWPPRVSVDFEMTPSLWARLALLVFALLGIAAALFHRRGSKRSVVLWSLAGASALAAAYTLYAAYPVDTPSIDLSRAVAAAVASAVVLRLGFAPAHAQQRASIALLAAMAALSVLTFYNFGHPQFYDNHQHEPTYVHTFDMRVYFPAVKYIDELGYDGVYLASVKSFADDELGGSLESIADVRLRDLRDYELRTVEELSDEIHGVKDRFSEERWSAFKRDMSYFWRTMGRHAYLDSLRDHGGNATPAWLLVAYWIYRSADATESTMLWAALLDPLLLLLFFGVAWRTFGLRVALVCLVAYGATTVYQFGSNWGGSTLRNDWMVLIGLGVCALKSKRLVLAGVLLGWAAMIRAFPALALLFLAVPIGWKLFDVFRARPEEGERQAALAALAPLVKVGAGVVLVVVAFGALSTATFGFDESWGAWSRKISMHANRPNVNHLGVTALVSFEPENLWQNLRARGEDPELWGPLTAQTMKDRRFIIIACMLFYTGLAIAACRRLRLADAAVIGTMMIPIYFYPSNYYLHILFTWPLMVAAWPGGGRDKEWALVAATVLIACAIKWFGWLIPGNYGQFLFFGGVLLTAILILLLIPIVSERRPRRVTSSPRVGRATSGTA